MIALGTPLHILHVVHVYPPEGNTGAENYTATLARLHAAAGHQVVVWTRGHDPALPPGDPGAFDEHGIRVYRDALGPQGREAWRRSDATSRRRFGRLLESFRPDVVHFQHLQYHDASLPADARDGGAATVMTLHDGWLACPAVKRVDFTGRRCEREAGAVCLGCFWGGRKSQVVSPRIVRAAGAWIAPDELRSWKEQSQQIVDAVDLVVSPSRFLRDDLAARGVRFDRSEIVGFGPLRPAGTVSAPRPDGPLRIGVIGGHADKGIGVAYAALEQVRARGVTLHHFGGDPAAMGLRVPDGVEVGGRYRLAELDRVFGAFDVLTVPSVWAENYPMVIPEAFARGRPVVASAIGGIPEMVRDGIDALLVPPGDPVALAAAWLRLVAADDRMRFIASVRPPRYADDHAQEMEALYRAVCAGEPG